MQGSPTVEFPRSVRETLAVLGGVVGAVIDRVPDAVLALMLLMALDIVSGLIAGGRHRRLSSSVSGQGMRRKGQAMIVVLMVAVLEHISGIDPSSTGLPVSISLTSAVALFYCVHEALSILENATEAGLPVPSVLQRLLASGQTAAGEESGRDSHEARTS